MTARALITQSMQLANIIQAGESPTADDINLAEQAFNIMIDSWSNDRLMIYSIQPYVFNAIAGQQDYLLGPGQNIVTYGVITPGSAYIDGTYINVPMISTTGVGVLATATITVLAGAVTNVQVYSVNMEGVQDGYGYQPGDILTTSNVNLGGFGSGFSVTVGTVSSGDWIVPRPMYIEQLYNVWNSGTPQQVDIEIGRANDSQWAAITVKNTPSTFAFTFYDNGDYPLRKISLWPIPTANLPIRAWLRQPIVDFTSLDVPVQFPPGYARTFLYNLAVEMAPYWGKTIGMDIQNVAVSSRLAIAKSNSVPQYSNGDGGLNKARKQFNYITGGFSPWGSTF